nr:hypothetical protein [Oscillospiraceae bacterium]
MYIDQLFYGDSGISLYADYGKIHLTANQLAIYNSLKADIEAVAAGTKTNTQFTYTGSGVTFDDIGAAVDCLMVDLPQSFYWYDKTVGCGQEISGSTAKITFAVANDYFATGGTTYDIDYTQNGGSVVTYQIEVDSNKINSARTAVANANSIVTKYSSATAEDKVVGYKTEICDLVNYNDDAVKSTYNKGYGDPWQLVYVFDGDASTDVVCEGYSKAFQYLCDLGGVDCYTVTGNMDGGTGAGAHMWNIVTLDEKNYLVDVTNCDAGSIGAPDLLCLKKASVSSPAGCIMDCSGDSVIYEYDADTIALYPRSLLTVEAESVETDLETDVWTTLEDKECDSWDAYINTTEKTEYDDLALSLTLDEGKSITDVAKITVRCDIIDIYGNPFEVGNRPAVSGTFGIVRGNEWADELYDVWDQEYDTYDFEYAPGDLQEGDEFVFSIETLPQNTGVAVYFAVEYNDDVSAGNNISIDVTSKTIAVGEKFNLTVTLRNPEYSENFTLIDSDYTIATAFPLRGENGVLVYEITGVSAGTATITFKLGEEAVSCVVTVIDNGGYVPTPSVPSYAPPAPNPAPVTSTTVVDTILAVPDGGNGSINLGSSTKLDRLAMDALSTKGDVTVKFTVAGGAYWEINGNNITEAKAVDLGVKVNSTLIPESKVNEFAGDKTTVQLTLRHNGDFGFTGTLNVPVGKANNGKFANLYYYHGGKFDFVGSSAISGGMTKFAFSHASNYLIVIDDYAYGEDVSSAAGMTETTTSAVPYAAAVVIIAAFGTSAIVLKKRLSK